MEKVRRRCGFFNGIDVPAEGSRRGLSLRKRKANLAGGVRVSMGLLRLEIKQRCGTLRHLGINNSLPWLVGGDFNDILFAHEERGGLLREAVRMEAFRKTLEECLLEDIGFSGPWFTWERGHTLERNIRERIDRGVNGVVRETVLSDFASNLGGFWRSLMRGK
ncbi:reverse transcriptase [Gossypium australe]|uniref:Reverse transcriptase n=1 Tax=Gossypium australe TaxID=47621 RepID=A0A5B6V170_9ROSI|nr:reverse transcriptase [Gossypium australe]